MAEICGDNRFELIEKYKTKLIKATNIETAKDEMAVIDSILFRFWQMGWLDKLETDVVPKSEVAKLQNELVIWKQNRFNFYQRLELYKIAREKVAREIFEEIEKSIILKIPMKTQPIFKEDWDFEDGYRDGKCDALIEVLAEVAELKKKYGVEQ